MRAMVLGVRAIDLRTVPPAALIGKDMVIWHCRNLRRRKSRSESCLLTGQVSLVELNLQHSAGYQVPTWPICPALVSKSSHLARYRRIMVQYQAGTLDPTVNLRSRYPALRHVRPQTPLSWHSLARCLVTSLTSSLLNRRSLPPPQRQLDQASIPLDVILSPSPNSCVAT